MTERTFVPFDDSYRVPVDVRVSRGVRCGPRLFTCGQMDLDAQGKPRNLGDLWAQTDTSMRLLFDVIEQAGLGPEGMLELHVFHRGEIDENLYRRRILQSFPACAGARVVLSPVRSFPSRGAEVEIDAIVIEGGERRSVETNGWVAGSSLGGWIFAGAEPSTGGNIGGQIESIHAEIAATLGRLDAGLRDVVKVNAYFAPGLDAPTLRRGESRIAELFAPSAPAYHGVRLPAPFPGGQPVRIEVIAQGERAEGRPARQNAPGSAATRVGSLAYSRAVRCGDVIFTSGQLPLSGSGAATHGGDLGAQTHAVMRDLEATLAHFGAGFEHMSKVNAYWLGEHDMARWNTNVGIRSSYYVKPGPASTGIEVAGVCAPGALISVDCIAVLD